MRRRLILPLEFTKAHCLLNSEVFLLLEDLQALRQQEMHEVSALPPPSTVFLKCLQHVSAFSKYKNRDIVREIRQ